MSRVRPKSRRWAPRVIVRQYEARDDRDVSSHLGGQFGFSGSRSPGVRSVRGGRPAEVKL